MYLMIMIFGTHVSNDDIPSIISHLWKVLIFQVFSRYKGKKRPKLLISVFHQEL